MPFEKLSRRFETSATPTFQRRAAGKSTVSSRLPVMRAARDANNVAEGADAAVDRAAGSAGQALPGDLRSRFEGSLGADLSSVRVHTGDASAQAADAVGAKAYTTGQDIHFGNGYYDPSSAFGVHLLAHEVAHTVQQQGSTATRQHKLEVSGPQDSAELEADRAADAMVSGAAFAVGGFGVGIAREPTEGAPAPAAPAGDAAAGGDAAKPPEKTAFPSWSNGTLSYSKPGKAGLYGMTMKYNPPSGDLTISGEEKMDLFKINEVVTANVLGPVQLVGRLSASGGLAAGGAGKVSGTWDDAPGPREEPVKQLTISGGGSGTVGPKIKGEVMVGPGFGIKKYTATAGLQGGLVASGGFNVSSVVEGSVTGESSPDVQGSITFTVAGAAKLESSSAIVADLILDKDKSNLYSYELSKRTVGELSLTCVATMDLKTGEVRDSAPIIVAKWNGFMDAPLQLKRPLNEAERAELFPGAQGASGAPADIPTETDVDCSDPGAGGGASACPGAPPPMKEHGDAPETCDPENAECEDVGPRDY